MIHSSQNMSKAAADEGTGARQQRLADFARFQQPEREIDRRSARGNCTPADRRNALHPPKLLLLLSPPQALSSSPSPSTGGVRSPAWLTAAWPAAPASPRPPAPAVPAQCLPPSRGTKPSAAPTPPPTLPRQRPSLCAGASRWEGGRCCATPTPTSRSGIRTTSWSPSEGARGRLTTSTCCSEAPEANPQFPAGV